MHELLQNVVLSEVGSPVQHSEATRALMNVELDEVIVSHFNVVYFTGNKHITYLI